MQFAYKYLSWAIVIPFGIRDSTSFFEQRFFKKLTKYNDVGSSELGSC